MISPSFTAIRPLQEQAVLELRKLGLSCMSLEWATNPGAIRLLAFDAIERLIVARTLAMHPTVDRFGEMARLTDAAELALCRLRDACSEEEAASKEEVG